MEHQTTLVGAAQPLWIDHPGALPAPADHAPLGLDTEFMRRNTYYPRLALAQVAHVDDCWLIDPLAFDAGAEFRRLVHDRVCIMHSASEDLEALAPLMGDATLNLFDTQIAAAMCGMGPGLSYQKLVAGVLDIDIPKDETRSDWLQRPLTASQLDYAAQDVTHLTALHDALTTELARRGRSEWHAQDCARMVEHAHYHQTHADPQPQRGFNGASEWAPEAQARLRRILQWRGTTARQLDRPRPWILDDAHALALAADPPADAHVLFERVKGQRSLRGAQRTELLGLLQAAATPEELATLEPIAPAPHGKARRAVDAMRDAVRATAERLDLPAGLLCPRRLLEEFAVTRSWPAGLDGWRRAELEPSLAPLLPD